MLNVFAHLCLAVLRPHLNYFSSLSTRNSKPDYHRHPFLQITASAAEMRRTVQYMTECRSCMHPSLWRGYAGQISIKRFMAVAVSRPSSTDGVCIDSVGGDRWQSSLDLAPKKNSGT